MDAETVIDVGDRKQLFIDDRFFAERSGIALTVNPPARGEIVLRPEKPWEMGMLGAYATVLEDDGVYKLWYDAWVGLHVSKEVPRSTCYATSTDGIHWRREKVNLFEWFGHRENNIVIPGADGSVTIDPQALAEHRYKSLATLFENALWPESRDAHWDLTGGCVHLLTSPDGIRWRRIRPPASPFFHDSQNMLLYDDRIRKYVAYLRTHRRGRTVGRMELDDPMKTPWPYRRPPAHVKPNEYGLYLGDNFGAYDVALACDETDPPDTDVQICPIVKYPWAENVYIGLFVPYRHYPETVEGVFLNDGPQDVQLTVSRDGIAWQRPQRMAYIRLGLAGSWDGGCLWPTLGMIRRGDEIWQYYCGTVHTHGGYDEKTPPRGGLCRVVQRLDGFVSADAAYTGGEFTTPLLRFAGATLELNADCSALGTIAVEILDERSRPIDGFTLSEAVPIDRNHIAVSVRWKSNAHVGVLEARPVRLHFKMRACKLYAFHFGG